ncbi:major facilitator superfamily domain-containing protein [Plectosphaerella plurivora]|uniref:Major facilitator superfamily domain-containing protein n=1 Tax=Plectosphaerella plurivora TaxID=936078 RepID=A0A9P9A735_9PEZI|nr:major facilitator superfamily domain-containing protein [Plectosphaerella plurivora]
MRCPDQQSFNAIAADIDPEKAHPTHNHDESDLHPILDPDANLCQSEKDKNARRLLWRLDLKLLPWLCILYLLAFLDRANIGNAKIAGLSADLGLSTAQFNATLTIFFVSYAVFEPLTNVLLKKLKPSIFIPILMIAWGGTMTGMGFVKNWSGLMAARWFLGFAEAGLFPGISLYLSCWYKRSELGLRTALFFSAAAIAGSFGGLLAAAIENMHGIGNLPGWAWIFILEGLLTVIFGFASFWAVYDFPDDPKTTFLSPEDKARAIHRLEEDHQASAMHEKFSMSFITQALRDWKMWLAMVIYSGCTMPLYAFSMFLPTIIHDLGWSTSVVQSQLYSAPPYIAGALLTLVTGYPSDRYARRGIFNIGCSIIALAGFIMQLASNSPAAKYTGTFLAALGIYPCIPNTISWISNNTEGVYKRGVVLGFVIGWGNLNGVVSSNIYFYGPDYMEGHSVVIAYLGVFCLGEALP